MNYYWFNKQELLQKAKETYDNNGGKENKSGKDVLREKTRNKYRNLTEDEKEVKRQYSRDRYNEIMEKLSSVIKMDYYWFNREKLLKNALNKYHNKGGKQKATEYYKKMQV